MLFIVTCSVLENPDFSPIAVANMKYCKQDGFQLEIERKRDNNLLSATHWDLGRGTCK